MSLFQAKDEFYSIGTFLASYCSSFPEYLKNTPQEINTPVKLSVEVFIRNTSSND